MKKTHAKALPLFGDLAVVLKESKGTKGKRQRDKGREPLTEAELRNIKASRRKAKAARKKRQAEAEKIQLQNDLPTMANLNKRNNASLRHISTFINMVEYAQQHNKPVALGELKKKIAGEEAAVKEWATIRNWLSKKAPACCAVSIGKRPRGIWVIRWVVVQEEPGLDIFTEVAPLQLYLVKSRGWSTGDIAMVFALS